MDDKLYASASNWPQWPMASSIEVFNADTLKHLATHSFGIQLGSFTWLDRWNGSWCAHYKPHKHDDYSCGWHDFASQVLIHQRNTQCTCAHA